uniref:Uncharacterized protein n=1 Tax=Ditylenchus dipsaci TaxID=166011 RepID=A0A915E9T2_9BILA
MGNQFQMLYCPNWTRPLQSIIGTVGPFSDGLKTPPYRSHPITHTSSDSTTCHLQPTQSKLAGSKKILKPGGPEASGHQQLALFPFFVLEKLFNLTSVEQVGLDKAVSVRNQALELGIVDVLLICLAHFAHQKPKCEQLREGQEHPDAVGQIIGHVLTATNCIETIKSLSNSTMAAAGQLREAMAKNTAVSAPTSTNAAAAKSNANFWAKGTGFGSGSTQQQWNVKEVMARRKQDEENVTCLLNVGF